MQGTVTVLDVEGALPAPTGVDLALHSDRRGHALREFERLFLTRRSAAFRHQNAVALEDGLRLELMDFHAFLPGGNNRFWKREWELKACAARLL